MSEKFSIAKLADKLSNNVQPVDNLTGSFEAIVLAFTGPIATWLIAIPNIWLACQWLEKLFGFDWKLSWPIAIGFEMVGASLTNLWSSCRQWNATEQDEKKRMQAWFALVLMVIYFIIDLAMVFVLAQQSFSDVQVPPEYLNVIFPVVVIIAALATNERTTLYRLRRERDKLQVEQKPNTNEIETLRGELIDLRQLIERLPMPRATLADFEKWYRNLNGEQSQVKSGGDVVRGLELAGFRTTSATGRKWLKELQAGFEVEK